MSARCVAVSYALAAISGYLDGSLRSSQYAVEHPPRATEHRRRPASRPEPPTATEIQSAPRRRSRVTPRARPAPTGCTSPGTSRCLPARRLEGLHGAGHRGVGAVTTRVTQVVLDRTAAARISLRPARQWHQRGRLGLRRRYRVARRPGRPAASLAAQRQGGRGACYSPGGSVRLAGRRSPILRTRKRAAPDLRRRPVCMPVNPVDPGGDGAKCCALSRPPRGLPRASACATYRVVTCSTM